MDISLITSDQNHYNNISSEVDSQRSKKRIKSTLIACTRCKSKKN